MAKGIAKSVLLQTDINQKGKYHAVKVNYQYFLAVNRLIYSMLNYSRRLWLSQ
jgi:hypothetical protein